MPVFDFECRICKKVFAELVRGAEKIICPRCGSADLKKLFSGFYTVSDATRLETRAKDLPSMEQWTKARAQKPISGKKREKARRLKMRELKPRAAAHKKTKA
ncbi:MAG: zinc ribbon domain-containing protein [Candidatus Margulisbacteria bacterium]|jgi:putative FmdB family regulatory protein|nr:zinc ribbon domain-containing protein [Candidatus Margulisiibacteriota bacterium]